MTLNDGVEFSSQIEVELRQLVRTKIAPFATPDFIQVFNHQNYKIRQTHEYSFQEAPGLPKTRSGKIMRRVLKKIANGDSELGDISTMADSSVVGVSITKNALKGGSTKFR